jgi:hypothetical protein
MPDNSAYLNFLRDPDQDSRRNELTTFFGPNAATFLRAYDKLREDTVRSDGGRPKFRLFGGGFEVAAFFLGPVWFFYRKMWILAWVVVGLMVAIAFVPVLSRAGLILALLLAGLAHRSYVQHAVQTLVKLRQPDGSLDPVAVQAAGGVSKPAGIVSGVIFVLLTVIGLVSIIYLAAHGIPPPR